MNDLLLAIGMSPREWPGMLHRFAADHGGARIRITALTEDDLSGEFDVLVLDDLCPFLTPRLVDRLSREGRAVVGLVDPEHAAEGRRVLRRCGVEAVLRSDVPYDELLGVAALAAGAADGGFEVDRPEEATVVGVCGPDGSSGKTEVAVVVARAMTAMGDRVVLADLDLLRPSVAVRLGLRPHPNLRTALTAHRDGRIVAGDVFQRVRRVDVLAGLFPGDDQPPPRLGDLSGLVRSLPASFVVGDVGSGSGLLADLRVVAGVGRADPVGLTRLLEWLGRGEVAEDRLHLFVNEAPPDPFARSEIEREIRRMADPRTVTFLPWDASVVSAAWECTVPTRGRFHRIVARWAERTFRGAGVGLR